MNKKILLWTIAVLWMIVIFSLSSQPAEISNANSKSGTKILLKATESIYKVDIDSNTKEATKLINNANNTLRDYAHTSVFFVLAILVYSAMRNKGGYSIKALIFSFLICFIFSILDEIHQIFTPGRGFQVSDLGMDFIGIISGIIIFILASRHIKNSIYKNKA